MLLQLHHQNRKTGETQFCLQRDIPKDSTMEEMMNYAWDKFPPEGDNQFLLVKEGSEYFMYTNAEG